MLRAVAEQLGYEPDDERVASLPWVIDPEPYLGAEFVQTDPDFGTVQMRNGANAAPKFRVDIVDGLPLTATVVDAGRPGGKPTIVLQVVIGAGGSTITVRNLEGLGSEIAKHQQGRTQG